MTTLEAAVSAFEVTIHPRRRSDTDDAALSSLPGVAMSSIPTGPAMSSIPEAPAANARELSPLSGRR